MNSAFMPGPGEARHTNAGETWVGEIVPRGGDRVTTVRDMLQKAGFETRIAEDPIAQIWNKFALNCAINPVSAVTGLRAGEIYRNPDTFALVNRVVDEVLAVVEAKGIRLPDPDIRRTILGHCRLRYNKPSMLQHVEQGRRTEIDALNGALVREAARLGIAVPVNETLVQVVKGIEQSRHRAVHGPALDEAALEAAAKAGTI
jgi:2-dehydropantoate 2-reductase